VTERLNRYLAGAGVASRRAVEEHIRAGRVTVNGAVAGLATRVGPDDEVRLDGRPVTRRPLRTVLLHKPAGVVTTVRDTHGRPTVVGLVGGDDRLFPVGRLDLETTGALLLTNDGDLAHLLMHPRHGVEKEYRATVEGTPDAQALEQLRRGIALEDGMTAPATVRLESAHIVRLTIHEGRNRQVRRMLAAVGHPVTALERTRYASLGVDDLAPGAWRELAEDELRRLRDA
jgi:23S rRNA pseudouridine2605 synthase